MPKYLVTIARGVAKPEVMEIAADSQQEACWIALEARGDWKDVGPSHVSANLIEDRKAAALKTAA